MVYLVDKIKKQLPIIQQINHVFRPFEIWTHDSEGVTQIKIECWENARTSTKEQHV
jgi:hypothetical protein